MWALNGGNVEKAQRKKQSVVQEQKGAEEKSLLVFEVFQGRRRNTLTFMGSFFRPFQEIDHEEKIHSRHPARGTSSLLLFIISLARLVFTSEGRNLRKLCLFCPVSHLCSGFHRRTSGLALSAGVHHVLLLSARVPLCVC